mgnify:FL=1
MNETMSLQLDDALRYQNFADGTVEYQLVEGVVHGTKAISLVRQDFDDDTPDEKFGQVITTVLREAWVQWNDPELPDTKFIYDAVDGQRIVLCYATAKNHDGKEVSEKLWVFNKSTKKNLFIHGAEHGGLVLEPRDNVKKYEFKSPISRLSMILHTEEDLRLSGRVKLFQKYGLNVSALLMAIAGYLMGGVWWAAGGAVAGVLLGLLLYFLVGYTTNIFHPDESQMSGAGVLQRVEDIRKHFGNS